MIWNWLPRLFGLFQPRTREASTPHAPLPENRHGVFLIGGEDDEQAVIEEVQGDETCGLIFHYRDKSIEAEADDFFEALCQIRLKLEPEGLIPFCYGASLNVYPSGMARGMGQGLKAYRLTVGEQARTADLVCIFDEGPDVIPAFVKVQEDFFQEWLTGLGEPSEGTG